MTMSVGSQLTPVLPLPHSRFPTLLCASLADSLLALFPSVVPKVTKLPSSFLADLWPSDVSDGSSDESINTPGGNESESLRPRKSGTPL